MKKILSILLALTLFAALLAGCSGQQKPSQPQEEPAAAEPEGIYVAMNGVNISLGIPFADLQDKLGEEVKPSETINSCDENSDWKQTMHFYDGVTVTEDKDGLIDGVEVSGDAAALMGKIRISSTKDEVIEVMGEPDTDAEWGMYYTTTNPWVNIYLDEETGAITGFALMKSMVAG